MPRALLLALALFAVSLAAPASASPYDEPCGGNVHIRCGACQTEVRNATTGEMECTSRQDCFVSAEGDCYLVRL